MDKLSTIQKREKLNEVFVGEKGVGGASHFYVIFSSEVNDTSKEADPENILLTVQFQDGARKDPNATRGVLDSDLLEIVRDRLKGFQNGKFATRENACALTHIEEALMWMNKRVEDRIERNVLGTYHQ